MILIKKLTLLITVFLLTAVATDAQSYLRTKTKKLIHCGWETPFPNFINDSLSLIESQPFDGMAMFIKCPAHDISMCMFSHEKVTQADIQAQLDTLKKIKWTKFTDNFIWVFTADASTISDFDWFNDSQWININNNAALLSKVVNEAGLKGIFFDTENYYGALHPWCIGKKYQGKTYAAIGKKVRQRGKEFMTALQTEKKDIRILSLLFYGYLAKDSTDVYSPLAKFFFDGMLEGMNSQSQIIDGEEGQYWSNTTYQFPYWTDYTKNIVPKSGGIATGLDSIYKMRVATSAGIFNNQMLGLDCKQTGLDCSNKLDSTTRLRWVEHNVYNALLNNDEYVWLYNQGESNWWRNFKYKKGANSAIISAKNKIKNHQRLGFTLNNADTTKTNHRGFYVINSDTLLTVNSTNSKRLYTLGDSIRVAVKSNDVWANYVRCYINGVMINQIPFGPFKYNFDTLKEGVYDIYALGYSLTAKLIQSNYITIEVKSKLSSIQSQPEINPTFKISPNPTSGIFTLDFIEPTTGKIEIINMVRQTVFTKNIIEETNLKIDMDKFPKGVYFVKESCKSKQISFSKLILQ
ncbi:MAG: T9SS type A sorting domain-containing protein [Bacteroidetes bacterium]|nr:T9SS type A sorting domain-containing protein [Bacteroidota bacterium]